MNHVVLGLNFGDEGKGLATDWLCRIHDSSLVVRFSGGCNAGHTVVAGDVRHVHSHLGSGTLAGVATFWSRFCPVSPPSFLQELSSLCSGRSPTVIFDPRCPLTTPWDVFWNQALERRRGGDRHGSCGVGLGTTMARHEEGLEPLYMADLVDGGLSDKLRKVKDHYDAQAFPEYNQVVLPYHDIIDRFVELVGKYDWHVEDMNLSYHDGSIVFEGSQGLLLDQELGSHLHFFPYVTRAFTSSRNASELIREAGLVEPTTVTYVTRSYLTRHGQGPLPKEYDEDSTEHLILEPMDETNRPNQWQGKLRTAPLDYELMEKAIAYDKQFIQDAQRRLFVSCLDHWNEIPDLSRIGHDDLQIMATSYGPSADRVG